MIGPVFTRELVVAPRRWKTYGVRVGYVGGLFGVAATAWLVLAGTQLVRNAGDMARFGGIVFQLLAVVQLVLVVFFSGVLSATAVSQEKDRRTLELLLLTRLANHELVLGKLLASVVHVWVVLAAAGPLFLLLGLWGGVSLGQVIGCLLVGAASAFFCGSVGATLAFWREKTLQSVAMTVLGLVLWLGFGELVHEGALGDSWWGIAAQQWASAMSPWRAILAAIQPIPPQEAFLGLLSPAVGWFLVVSVFLAALLNAVAIVRVRVWNPPQPFSPPPEEEGLRTVGSGEQLGPCPASARSESFQAEQASLFSRSKRSGAGQPRRVWDNPILWREICTWAYGRKILLIKLIYWLLFAGAAIGLVRAAWAGQPLSKSAIAMPVVPVFLLSLMLLNAQAVISMTTERDAGAMDLLLVSDLTPGEILFGKLGGVWYNGKDWLLGPVLLCVGLWLGGIVRLENVVYLALGMLVLFGFVSVLGIHTGMTFPSSRLAIATSLATVFFLCVGVAVCMMIMVAFSGSFQAQLQPFLAMMVGGGLGLYVVMAFRTPSSAKALAAFGCPLATFYAITSFLLEYTLGVFLVVVGAYGFATAALLVPALAEFDVATGRTTSD